MRRGGVGISSTGSPLPNVNRISPPSLTIKVAGMSKLHHKGARDGVLGGIGFTDLCTEGAFEWQPPKL